MTLDASAGTVNIPESLQPSMDRFSKIVHSQQKKCWKKWQAPLHSALTGFQQAMKDLLDQFEASPDGKATPESIWNAWLAFLKQGNDYLAGFDVINTEQTLDEVLFKWDAVFEDYANSIDEVAIYPQSPADWKIEADDSIRTKAWKARQGLIHGLVSKFKKNHSWQRTVKLRDFHRYFLGLEARQHLFDEWNIYLQRVAQNLAELHTGFTQVIEASLFIEGGKHVWAAGGQAEVDAAKGRLLSFLQIIDSLIAAGNAQLAIRTEETNRWCTATFSRAAASWQAAGTSILANRRFNEGRLEQKETRQIQKFDKYRSAWITHFDGEKSDWRSDFFLQRIQFATALGYRETTSVIRERIETELSPPINEAIDKIKASAKAISVIKSPDIKSLRSTLTKETSALLKILRTTTLPNVARGFVAARMSRIVPDYCEKIALLAVDLPDKEMIMTKRVIDTIPPQSRIEPIPMREFFDRELIPEQIAGARTYDKELQKKLNEMMNSASELDQVVEFNLKAALEWLGDQKDTASALENAQAGLQRSQERMDEQIVKLNQILEESQEYFLDSSFSFAGRVQSLLSNDELIKLTLKLIRAKAKEKARETRRRVWHLFKQVLPLVWAYLLRLFNIVREQYFRLGGMAGLIAPPQQLQEEIVQYLNETEHKISQLPYIYQRLFTVEPLVDDRLFAGRQDELATMREDLEKWKAGRYMSTAIIGEFGSGHTSLLNIARRDIYKDVPTKLIDLDKTHYLLKVDILPLLIETFELEKVETIEDFEQHLLELEEPLICIVENVHKLFSRTVGGFALIKRFLAMIYATHPKVFWILTFTQYSWEYIDKVIGLTQHFQRVLSLEGMSRQDIEAIVFKRHRITGYQLEFEVTPALKKNRHFRKLSSFEAQQEFIQNKFFTELQDVARGNISMTLLYWMRSIIRIEENKLFLSSSIHFDSSFVYQLASIELFTLGALLQHEMLTPGLHARVFHQSEESSKLLFNGMHRKGIVVTEGDGYRVHPFLYRAAVRALKNNHILH